MSAIKDIANILRGGVDVLTDINARGRGNMINVLSDYIVEPVMIIDKELFETTALEDTMRLNINIFAAFYAQVFTVLTQVNGNSMMESIKLLSTTSISAGKGLLSYTDSLEEFYTKNAAELAKGFKITLPDLTLEMGALPLQDIAVESNNKIVEDSMGGFVSDVLYKELVLSGNIIVNNNADGSRVPESEKNKKELQDTIDAREKKLEEMANTLGKPSTSDSKELARLDKEIDEQRGYTEDGNNKVIKIEIPIIIKALTYYMPPASIVNIIEPRGQDKGFMARLDEYRSGGISLGDFLFAGDLIKKYKQNKLKDKEGILALLNIRTASSTSKIVSSKGIGFERAYNMIIMKSTTALMVEKYIKGKFSVPKYKEAFLSALNGLSLTIIDEDYERINLYTTGISGSSSASFKAIAKKKGKNEDLSDVIKALITNKPPVL